jgi:RHS repeat-associated protein
MTMRSETPLTRIAALLCAALLSFAAPRVRADVGIGRGFQKDAVYQQNDVDAVNLASGALMVTVPVGQTYKSSGTLQYSFQLVYNSQLWDYHPITVSNFVLPSMNGLLSLEKIHQRCADAGNGACQGYEVFTPTAVPGPGLVSLEKGSSGRPRAIAPATITGGGEPGGGVETLPGRVFNAGFGWTMTLGDLYDGFRYIAPDGAEHIFYAGAEPSTPGEGSDLHGLMYTDHGLANLAGPFYTRDGSYLRMTKIAAGVREISFPDGIHKRYRCDNANPAACEGDGESYWLLDQIADPFGNVLYIDRAPEYRPQQGSWTWTLHEKSSGSDGYADPSPAARAGFNDIRQHTMTYTVTQGHYGIYLNSLALAGFNGQLANYKFAYDLGSVFRGLTHNWALPGDLIVPYNADKKVDVPFLRRVEMPYKAGDPVTTASGPGGEWSFDYYHKTRPANPGDDPEMYSIDWEGLGRFWSSAYDGMLREVTLPTGGGIEYTWVHGAERGGLSPRGCGNHDFSSSHSPAIARRQVKKNGVADGPPTLYYGTANRIVAENPPAGSGGCSGPKEFLAMVVLPDGNTTVSYYSIYHGGYGLPSSDWRKNEFGLPFTRAERDPDSPAGAPRFLSTSTYQCSQAVFTSSASIGETLRQVVPRDRPGVAPLCGNPVRSTYVRYEYSGDNCVADSDKCTASNARVAGQSTRYFDDVAVDAEHPQGSPRFSAREMSSFDGLGHYREARISGNFAKATFQNQNVGDETYSLRRYNPNAVYTGFGVMNIPSNWILETYDLEVAAQQAGGKGDPTASGAMRRKTVYDFHPVNGRLLAESRLWHTDAGAVDAPAAGYSWSAVVGETGNLSADSTQQSITTTHVRVRNADGTVTLTDKKHMGADSSAPDYATETIVQYGGPQSVKIKRTCPTSSAPDLQQELNAVDRNTGLVASSTDAANLTTSYDFDMQGRMLQVTPPGQAATSYQYFKPNASSPAAACPGTADDAVSTSWARVVGTRTGTQDSFAIEYRYDAFGRLAVERSLLPGGVCSTTKKTFDGMGRLVSRSAPGGATTNGRGVTSFSYDLFGRTNEESILGGGVIKYSYGGARLASRTVLTGSNGTTVLGTRNVAYDGRGRLIKVSEPTASTPPFFRYQYGPENELTEVYDGGSTLRVDFDYDRRGLLASEKYPETTVALLHRDYDAGGLAHTRMYAGGTPMTLFYDYDLAGRVTQVRNSAVVLKEFFYDGSGNGVTAKLRLAKRHNRIPSPDGTRQQPDFVVSNSYGYSPSTGFLLTDTVSGGIGLPAQTTTYAYDDLGSLASIRYPGTCNSAGCLAQPLVLHNDHTVLTRIDNFLTGTTFDPSGLFAKVTHANNTVDQQTIDPSGALRPQSLRFTRAGASFGVIGDYGYDKAGQILSISGDVASTFTYDDAGRLSTYNVGGSSGIYTYDIYGNRTDLNGESAGPVNSANNHLNNATYDFAGRVTHINATNPVAGGIAQLDLAWDAFPMPVKVSTPDNSYARGFIYDAADERVGVVNYQTRKQRWSVRSLDNHVLSDFDNSDGTWRRTRDYVYRGGSLLAEVANPKNAASVVTHYHLDHLGSARYATNSAGALVDQRSYLPFGQERGATRPDDNRLKFTGHERDDDGTPGKTADLDYMHARFYSAAAGRFLSMDPARGVPSRPQSWNRYAYVQNVPLLAVDPTGADLWIIVTNQVVGQSVVRSLPGGAGVPGQKVENVPLYKAVIVNESGSVRLTSVTRDTNATGPVKETRGKFGSSQEAPPGTYDGRIRTDGKKGFRVELSDPGTRGQIVTADGIVRGNVQMHIGPGCSEGCMLLPGGKQGRADFAQAVTDLVKEDQANPDRPLADFNYGDWITVTVESRDSDYWEPPTPPPAQSDPPPGR